MAHHRRWIAGPNPDPASWCPRPASPGNFVKIETTAAHRLPPHARRLYALLADRKRQREPYGQWSLDNLRGLLGIGDKRAYDRWNNLRQRILDPALEAINDFGTVRVKMMPVKSGRSVAAVRFDCNGKTPTKPRKRRPRTSATAQPGARIRIRPMPRP